MDRTRKASWGFLSGLAFAGMTVVVGLAATPLLLRWLGPERFGAFRAASDWTGHLTIFELGLSWALIPLSARALGQNDVAAVRAILRAGVRIYLGVALLMLAVGAGLALVILHLIPVSLPTAHDLEAGCWVALLAVLVVPLSPFRALAEADQRSYLINILLIVQTATVTGLALLFAGLGWGITGQFLAASVGLYPLFFFLMRDGLRRYSIRGPEGLNFAPEEHCESPEAEGAKRKPNLAAIRREIWKMNWPSLIRNMCGRIGLYTDNLLVAYFLGPAVVASFYLTQRTFVLAQSQLLGMGSSGWAGLVELFHRGHIATFHRRLIELTGLVTVLGIAVMVPLAAFNRDFISLWVGPGSYGGEWITGLAAANGILLSIFSLWGLVVSGAGHVARVVPGTVASAAVNIVVSIVATIFLGPPGPLLGTLTALVTVNSWFFPMLLKKLFRVPLWPLFRAIASPVVIGIPYALAIRWFAHAHPPQGWILLALDMTGSAVLYLGITWLTIFKAEERAVWSLRLRMLLRVAT
jgi:O-antigen/teichoic acid export membrane protein